MSNTITKTRGYRPNPWHRADSYKLAHRPEYPEGMEFLQSNFTARGSRLPDVTHTVFVGLQGWLEDWSDNWQLDFFDKPVEEAIASHKRLVTFLLGKYDLGEDHIRDLHALGYLPLKFSALDEGTEVPLRVPFFLIENTVPGYGWLVNYIETDLSFGNWLPITSATIALRFRRLLDRWAAKTSDTPELVDWQGHDFSARGLEGFYGAAFSGLGHLLSFAGTDNLPALDWLPYFYDAHGFIGGSVPASEHSVMCAGGEMDEEETVRRLMWLHGDGIFSVVGDTWSIWDFIGVHLKNMKDEILAIGGKLVTRPDSGDPVDILCGTLIERYVDGHSDRKKFGHRAEAERNTPEEKGVVELLWDIFGGTVNSKGYKVLDPHVGVIYGDSITYERADQICERLEAKGFASTNVVLGVGSFTYQYNTRDTFGMAMKATWSQINGEGRNMFKDPVTDNGVKKSAKGRLAAHKDLVTGDLYLIQEASAWAEKESQYKPVWVDGKFVKRHTFAEIAQRVGVRRLMPA